MPSQIPVLYSFRRCPYAIRARLAVHYSDIAVELREVVLKDKPAQMLALSPKGTVPVLQLATGEVIDESFEVMLWALQQNDPDNWLQEKTRVDDWVARNDGDFKHWLDRYKYAVGYPQHSAEYYREQAMVFLQSLEHALQHSPYLLGDSLSAADIAVLPFIRQFAFVDKAWFDQAGLPKVQSWLETFLQSALFIAVMYKYPQWHSGDDATVFGSDA